MITSPLKEDTQERSWYMLSRIFGGCICILVFQLTPKCFIYQNSHQLKFWIFKYFSTIIPDSNNYILFNWLSFDWLFDTYFLNAYWYAVLTIICFVKPYSNRKSLINHLLLSIAAERAPSGDLPNIECYWD